MTNIKPAITTIIPTYNRAELLQRAIKSILSQSYSNFKICIFDNASDDNTCQIVENYVKLDSRIQYFRHNKNIGAIKNFNFGLSRINTPYFSFLSDDDILLPEFYNTTINLLQKYPELGFCATEVLYVNKKAENMGFSNTGFSEGYYYAQEGLLNILENKHPPCWTGIAFSKKVINKIGLLDEMVGGSIDYDFIHRVAAYFPYYISKKVGASFLIHESSWGQSTGYEFVWPSWKKMISNIVDDEKLDKTIRDKFSIFYKKELISKIYYYARQDIKHKNFDRVYECAKILSLNFNAKILSFLLLYTAKLIDFFPRSYVLILRIIDLKNKIKNLIQ